ncbi:uncharacterized protein LOC135810834 isoform X2 [Sycon ciliatum]|uniref:uncharacterized protein LOC135810834 isoform X2 n=1 Tax=Sycon ciliatum TaxID=27933 RepID=UPI0031F6D9CA
MGMLLKIAVVLLPWLAIMCLSSCTAKPLSEKYKEVEDILSGLSEEHVKILKDLTVDYEEKYSRRQPRHECNITETFITENCGLDCRCVQGRMKCCRLRQSIDSMSKVDIERYSAAFLKAWHDPRYKEAFRVMAWLHPVMGCNMVIRPVRVDLHHALMAFHRLTLLAFENLLRLVDCKVTIPFWDVGRNEDIPYPQQRVFTIGTFGGNGAPHSHCVQGPPYGEGFYTPPKFLYKRVALPYANCLRREVGYFHKGPFYTTAPYPWQLIEVMISAINANASVLAEDGIIEVLDASIHVSMGGSFANVFAQVDPIFYLVHSYNDKIMAAFQAKGRRYKTGDGLWNTTQRLSVFNWLRMNDFLDIMDLPGGVCTRYGASRPREEAIRMKNYLALELPRDDHLYVPYEILREMNVNSVFTKYASYLSKFYKKNYKSFRWTESGFHLDEDWRKDFHTVNFFSLKKDPALRICNLYAREAANFRNYSGSASSKMLIG